MKDLSGIDGAVLTALCEVGGETLVDQLFELFLDYTPTRLQGIRKAIDADNPRELAYWAHSLRSGAASIGARELSGRARVLENLAVAETGAETSAPGAVADRVSESLAELLSSLEELQKTLRGYLVERQRPETQTA